jgi:hypothetical protein
MKALQHADEDDGMSHRLPILRVKIHQTQGARTVIVI